MASALLSLAGTIAPVVIDLISNLVTKFAPQAEQKYGPKTGPVKFADVFSSVMGELQKAAAAGQIPSILPTDETVKAMIQACVSSLNSLGALVSPVVEPSGSSSSPASITLKPGQTLTISVVP